MPHRWLPVLWRLVPRCLLTRCESGMRAVSEKERPTAVASVTRSPHTLSLVSYRVEGRVGRESVRIVQGVRRSCYSLRDVIVWLYNDPSIRHRLTLPGGPNVGPHVGANPTTRIVRAAHRHDSNRCRFIGVNTEELLWPVQGHDCDTSIWSRMYGATGRWFGALPGVGAGCPIIDRTLVWGVVTPPLARLQPLEAIGHVQP